MKAFSSLAIATAWLLSVPAVEVQAATVTWTGGAGGTGTAWDLAANWGGNLPGANDDAVIPAMAGSPTIQITSTAGTIQIKSLTSSEPINISGGTLQVTTTFQSSSNLTLAGGTIKGGTVVVTGGASFTATGGTLDGVTLGCNLTVQDRSGLTIKNGLTLSNNAKLATNSTNTSIYYTNIFFLGTQTLSGTGEVSFGGTSSHSVLYAQGDGTQAGAAVLTIGSGVTVHGTQGGTLLGYNSFDSILNQGVITEDTAGMTITIGGALFTNAGTVSASAGTLAVNATNWTNGGGTLATSGSGILNLGGNLTLTGLAAFNRNGGTVNITGVLDNTGATLSLSGASSSSVWNLSTGTIKGGTVVVTGGASFTATGGTLDGVTLGCNLTAQTNSGLAIKNGLTLSNNAKLATNSTSSGSLWANIFFVGSQTLGGTGEVSFGGTTSHSAIYAQGDGTQAGAAVLTIGSGVTVHGTQSGNLLGLNSFDSILNQGIITADTAGTTLTIGGPLFTNQGIIDEQNSAIVVINPAMRVDGSGALTGVTGGNLRLVGDLVGNTTNAQVFSPQATVTFQGSGTSASPQQLEAMSQDLLATPAGLVNNFVYGKLALSNNTYVRLIDLSDNASGTPEAVYANTVAVPAGCTLDLNNLHLYTHVATVGGAVIGGTITLIPYTVTPSAGPNGSISPNTTQAVNNGGSAVFAATPAFGYTVDQWLVNGSVAQSGGSSYTLSNVTGDTTVLVTFTPVGWLDGFESYAQGSQPTPTWVNSGNSAVQVEGTVVAGGSRAVSLYGVLGGDWAALIHRQLNIAPAYLVECDVRNGSETLSGVHPWFGGVALNAGPSWTTNVRDLLYFAPAGGANNIYAGDPSSPSTPIIGHYTPLTWHHVAVAYEFPNSATVKISYWIDGSFLGAFSQPSFGYENSLAYLTLVSGEGTTWFDNVRVSQYTPAASTNADLSNLTLSSGTLSPAFAPAITNYTASVTFATSSLTVTPTAADANAAIQARVNGSSYATVTSGSASGSLPLNVGSNTVDVKVTAQDGTTIKTYTVTVTRAGNNNADLSNLTLSNGTLTPAFAPATIAYSASVPFATSSLAVLPTAADANATIQARVNGNAYAAVTSGSNSSSLPLNVGSNTVDVKVTAQDGTTLKTYTVTVTRATPPTNADLSALVSSTGTLTPIFAPATTSYTVTLPYATSSITLTPTVADSSATVTVNGTSVTSGSASGSLSLNVGDNVFPVVVTAQAGNTKTYNVTVHRKSNVSSLASLSLSDVTLSPVFSSGTTTYTATVPYTTTSTTVSAMPTSALATLTGTGSMPLAVGPNTLSVIVTAEDGSPSITTYNVTVTRTAASTNADLSNLVPNPGTLVPAFSSSATSYTVTLPYATSSLTLTPTVADATATVTVNGSSVTSGSASGSLSLNVGDNPFPVIVTAQAGNTKTYNITVHRKSNVSSLASLSLSGVTLSPVFSSGTTTYTATVPYTTTSTTVSATPTSALAALSGTGAKSLAVGANALSVIVTAEDGSPATTYAVTVTRTAASTNADLSGLVPTPGTLSPIFAPPTTGYTIVVPYATTSITLTPSVADSNAFVKINGTSVASGSASGALALSVGDNAFPVVVTAQDGTTTKTYTVTVHRKSNVSSLASLSLSGVTLSPVFSSGTTTYTVTVPYTTSSTIVSATPTSSLASLFGTGPNSLKVGANALSVIVTAEDGSPSTTYTVTVTRMAASTNADLSALVPSAGSLTPAFAPATTNYTVTVPYATTSLTLTPTVADATATVKVNGTSVTSGSASGSLSLNVGNNTFPVVVTAQDGITPKTYNVTVHRKSNVSTLASLTLSGITFSPAFSSGTTTYTATVPYTTTSTTVSATTTSALASLSGNGVKPLNIGTTAVSVVVTAEDGSPSTTYTVTVTRSSSGNANLATLSLSAGTLSPSFDPAIIKYTTAFTSSTTSVTVAASAADSASTIAVTPGTAAATGSINTPVSLRIGLNVVTVKVTAPNGTSKAYTIFMTVSGLKIARFDRASDIPFTSNDFPSSFVSSGVSSLSPSAYPSGIGPASASSVSFLLNFIPIPGTKLTVIKNVGSTNLEGVFSNLSHGDTVSLLHDGVVYDFVANYHGGGGADLVLEWGFTRILSWGNNDHGQLGNGTATTMTSPTPADTTGVLSGQTIIAVAMGASHCLALSSNGVVYSWGDNSFGQLGNKSNTSSSIPVQVDTSGVLFMKTVIAIGAGWGHSLAVCSDGTVVSWGSNSSGQLGDGTTQNRNSPVQVVSSGTPLQGRAVVALSGGTFHSLALCSDGTMAAWGSNGSGQLGNSGGSSSLVPSGVTVSAALSGRLVKSIGSGKFHNVALCTDGAVVAWGDNSVGQLGTGTLINSAFPIAVSSLPSGKVASSVAVGGAHNLVVCTDGTLMAWGDNQRGQLGTNSTSPSLQPAAVNATAGISALAGRTVVLASAGAEHSIALCSDGTLASWGADTSGELGNGGTADSLVPAPIATDAFGAEEHIVLGTTNSQSHFSFCIVASQVSHPASIQDWKLSWYGTNENAGFSADDADPYQTGIPNLLVLACFGPTQDPQSARISQLPAAHYSGGQMVISFTQPAGVSGITYGAEWSTTLQSNDWHAIPDSGSGYQHVFGVSTGSNARVFMRLKVSTP